MFDNRAVASIAVVALVVTSLGAMTTGVAGTDAGTRTPGPDATGELRDASAQQTTTQQTATESEPNDGPDTANPVRSGTRIRGAVASSADLDGFSVQVESGQTIRANLTRTSGQGLLAIVVFGPDGEIVSGVIAEPGETTRLSAPANRTGRYDVVVAAASQFGVGGPGADGTGEYVLEVRTRSVSEDPFTFDPTTSATTVPATTERTTRATTAAPGTTTGFGTEETTDGVSPDPSAGGAESEPNDDPSSANPLELGGTINGQIADANDLDGFRVEVPAGETITTELARGPGGGTLVYGVLGPDGELVTGGLVNATETVELTADAIEGGTYYVVVTSSSRNPGTGPYSLTVRGSALDQSPDGPGFDIGIEDTTTADATTTASGPTDANEPNDDGNTATALSPGTPLSGAVDGADVDVFAVEMQQGTTYNITLSRQSGDGTLGISLVGPDGTFVPLDGQQIYQTSFVDTYVTYTAERTGTHYFVVRAGTGGGPYRIDVTEESSSGFSNAE